MPKDKLDVYELESIGDIARTEGFEVLMSQVAKLAGHHEQQLMAAAASEPIETIRYIAGRLNGIRLVLSWLEQQRTRRRGE